MISPPPPPPPWPCPSSFPKLAGLGALPWPKTQNPGVPLFVGLVTIHNLMAAVFSAGASRTYLATGSPWAGKAARQPIWAWAWGKSKTLLVATAGLPCARVKPGSCQPAMRL